MPYRHAWVYLAALLAATFVAFWPGYFSKLTETSWEFHVHGITAGLWIVMLLAQSWTVHHGGMAAHRLVGRTSLLLFPAFIAGGVLLSVGFAERYVGRVSEFHIQYAPRLALSDLVSMVGVAWFYFHALKWRRKVHLHARYMLVTPIFLLGPIFGRILTAYGPFAVGSDAELYRFGESLRVVALATIIGLVLLYRAEPKHGRPYLERRASLRFKPCLWKPWVCGARGRNSMQTSLTRRSHCSRWLRSSWPRSSLTSAGTLVYAGPQRYRQWLLRKHANGPTIAGR